MPATRSSSRLQAQVVSPPTEEAKPKKATLKRKADAVAGKDSKKAKPSKGKAPEAASDLPSSGGESSGIPNQSAANEEDTPVPAVLSFDFEQAKNHLITVDSRFQDLFSKMPCRPFEHLEQVHPFRLYNSDIPEELTDEWVTVVLPSNGSATKADGNFVRTRNKALDVFPSPHQVVGTDLALLRTAGLSARKAEYIHDLAGRFADGRLSTEKLLNSTDEELAEMLIQVKGIGRYGISPEKIGGASSTSKQKKTPKASASAAEDKDTLPAPGDAVNVTELEAVAIADGAMADGETSLLPTPFTPSIRKTLSKVPTKAVSLPGGLTVSVLKGRLDGKKVK
ncbi:hypothetical protein MD484_g3630, partial [Candolleomyces efflorescens]